MPICWPKKEHAMKQTKDVKEKSIFSKIQNVWKNRWKILDGIWHTYFPNSFVKRVAKYRSDICQLNACGYYNKDGSDPRCLVPGKPCCTGCGCNEKYKVHSLSSYCHLKDVNKVPLWEAVMTEEEERSFRKKTGITNEW